ncbi:uncharacterized protein N7459_005222 [Penicillium hispanicum]|uniref:uncharacterized protein n=1 Tax=Penicillium hispanicum TaxID=1080232 RepID=UPI002541F726|nr:uncharacterized protein N7459_005222 [Penicillium hispanicum]KAJ5585422.1 hypothetical protein N7459_005222 [Penicillium hispanicum]
MPSLPNGRIAAEKTRIDHHESDVVIIGAGILGCALAVALGRQGRSELLQPGGVQALEELGLRDCLDEIDAIPVKGYYVSYFGEPVVMDYPRSAFSSEPAPQGWIFHHGRFVMRLRTAAMACPNVTVVEAKATGLVTSTVTGQVLGVETKHREIKDCYFAQLTVAADGYNSDIRKVHHPYRPKVRSRFWGLEMIDAELPSPYYGHVLSDNAPVLMYQIGARETRILVDVPENIPSASVKEGGVKGYLQNKSLPALPESVQPAFLATLKEGKLRSMPNSFLPAAVNKTPGLMILGDALNMRHPLTGGGMTVALNDVCIIRKLLSLERVPSLSDTRFVLKQLSAFHWIRKNSSSVINILAQALYMLFAADNQNLKALQRGCFHYFQIGMVDGPIGLLAGLIKQATDGPVLPFFLCRLPLHLDSVPRYALDALHSIPIPVHYGALDGLRCHFPVYMG